MLSEFIRSEEAFVPDSHPTIQKEVPDESGLELQGVPSSKPLVEQMHGILVVK